MRISSQPAWQNSGLCEISSFQARLTRWAKLRVAMVPFTIILEPLSECMVLGAFASWAVSFLFNWDPLSFYLVHILLWFLCDWILISIVQSTSVVHTSCSVLVVDSVLPAGWQALHNARDFTPESAKRSAEVGIPIITTWGGALSELVPRLLSTLGS
uniref:Uncharacterized protein n=1 Tax=Timema monikensis TaxID=170555 RepID=A0A7R9ECG6_9NEOP|nr:unnamed protein product [Timema monikensis]